jgi:hypothetical protein
VGPLTRRGFLCSLAALSASRVAPVPVAAAAVPVSVPSILRVYDGQVFISTTTPGGRFGYVARAFCREPRRDDGDTILELR